MNSPMLGGLYIQSVLVQRSLDIEQEPAELNQTEPNCACQLASYIAIAVASCAH